MRQAEVRAVCEQMERLGSDRVSTRPADLESHARDEGWQRSDLPDAVVFPRNTEEVAEVVRACAARLIPVVAFGAGTSVEGQVLPISGGIALDLSRMDQILAVHTEDEYCIVQPGVTRTALNRELRATGYFFPIDPGADATLGGMASTRASGTNAVRYGTMREAVLGLEVVLADGSVIRTGRRTRKSAAGLDLTALFVGAEGTLGILTELTIRLHPTPAATSTTVASFPTLRAAIETVSDVMQAGLNVARLEFLDDTYAEALSRFENLSIPRAPLLLMEFSGHPAAVADDADVSAELARERGALKVERAIDEPGRAALWRARHRAYWAGLRLRPGARAVVTDVCVPRAALVDVVTATREDLDSTGLIAPMLGHVGDGNFHATLLVDPNDHDEVLLAEAAHERMVQRALQAGGTCSGEHGIGLGKRPFLSAEHGDAVEHMRLIKRLFDPNNILNPGKMY